MHPVGLKCEPKVSYQTLITKTLPERPNSRLGGSQNAALTHWRQKTLAPPCQWLVQSTPDNLNMNRLFRRLHSSTLRYRWTRNGFNFADPKSFRGFQETGPWRGTSRCVLDTISQYVSLPRRINGYRQMLGVTLQWTSIPYGRGGEEILLDASCHRNCGKLELWLFSQLNTFSSWLILSSGSALVSS